MIFFKAINEHLNKRYNLLADIRIKRILCFGIPFFIFFFLIVFQPFNINLTQSWIKKISAIFLFSLSGSLIWTLHLYGIFKNKKGFSVGATILIIFWISLLIGISNFVISELFSSHVPFNLHNLPVIVFWSIITGITPITFIVVIYEIYSARSKVKFIHQINKTITLHNGAEKSIILTINASIGLDCLSMPLNHLLYLQAAGNYVDVYYCDNECNLKHNLIRNTLSEVILQLNKQCDKLVRCHHSYVVNLNKVDRIIGNSSSYKAVLKDIKIEIPISKKYKDQFLSLTNLV